MEEIYWLTRLDPLKNCLTTFLVISAIALAVFIFARLVTENLVENGLRCYIEYNKKWMKISTKWIKILIPVVVSLSVLLSFIPSSRDAFLIYGVGGTIDYVKSDTIARELPHKVVLAADKYLEELIKEDREEEK